MSDRLITAARAVPYSSVVGGGVMLIGKSGTCIGILGISNVADEETSDAIANEVVSRLLATSDSQAALDVLNERARQQSVEGWTEEHDDEHDLFELARAGACYAMTAAGYQRDNTMIRQIWPFDEKMKPSNTRRRDLVKAAATILADIERIDRAEERGGEA